MIGSGIEGLYRDQGPRLWRALLAFTGDPEVASDTVAEAFAQAIRRGDGINSPERWVWRSAFKIASGEMKRRRSQLPSAGAGSYDLEPPAVELVQALSKLPRTQRVSVVLHHAAGYPVAEIAEILGTSAASVKVHLLRGRRRLAELLGDDYEH